MTAGKAPFHRTGNEHAFPAPDSISHLWHRSHYGTGSRRLSDPAKKPSEPDKQNNPKNGFFKGSNNLHMGILNILWIPCQHIRRIGPDDRVPRPTNGIFIANVRGTPANRVYPILMSGRGPKSVRLGSFFTLIDTLRSGS